VRRVWLNRRMIGRRRRVHLLAVATALALVCLPGASASASASAGHLFWASSAGIQRADADGTNARMLLAGTNYYYLAVDAQHVFFAANGDKRIGRMDLDGGNPDPNWITGLTRAPAGLASAGGRVCWTSSSPTAQANDGQIGCTTVDAAGAHGAVNEAVLAGLDGGGAFAMDASHIYFVVPLNRAGAATQESIGRADVDGRNVNPSFLPGPFNLVDALAVNANHVYLGIGNPQNEAPHSEILSAPLDGGGTSTVETLDPQSYFRTLAASDDTLYWVNISGQDAFKHIATSAANGAARNEALVSGNDAIQAVATEPAAGCRDSIDFQTSMVATGCFLPTGKPNELKAKGTFRMNGIDFKSGDDSTAPVVFDTQRKTVDGDLVSMSLSAPGWGGGWFAWQIPTGLHMTFPYGVTRFSYFLKTPLSATPSLDGRALGFLQLGGLVSPTLFGFPAHAPGIELEFTPGHTSLTVQISIPTTPAAFIDPINGLWKVRDERGREGISYPTLLKVKITANNTDGVDYVEGTGSPANVYGIDTAKKGKERLVFGAKGKPAGSVIELAKLRLGWQLAKGIIDAGAVLVLHGTPTEEAKSMLPADFFFGQRILSVDTQFTWRSLVAFGTTVYLPWPTRIAMNLNSLNKIVPPLAEAGIFWQRIGLTGGYNLNFADPPFDVGGSIGFSWLPRFKHDFLWFQEAASLDATGDIVFGPFALKGTGDLKVIGANLVHGAFSIGTEGLDLVGTAGLDFNEILRVGIPLNFRGLIHLGMPAGAAWQLGGAGKAEVWKFNLRGDLIWNSNGIGFCATAGALKGKGIYFDGATHQGGCEGGPFADGSSAGVFSSGSGGPTGGGGGKGDAGDVASASAAKRPVFRVTKRSRLTGVAIVGTGGAPYVRITGPGGLSLAVDQTHPTAQSGDTVLIANPSDKTTYLSFQNARVGTYRIETLPGSSPIRIVGYSANLAQPRVRATVRSAGCAQRLAWHVRPLPGQAVTFLEQIKGKPDRALITTTKARGTLTFTPQTSATPGRTILARVMQQGTPRTTVRVARFRATTGNPPGAVRGLKGRRRGGTVALSWTPVCGALTYLVTTTASGTTAKSTSKKTRVTVKAGKRAKVAVAAAGPFGALGKAATVTVK
jgi:hypothetical protein